MLKKLLIGFAGLIVILVIAVVAIPFLIPVDTIRNQVQAQVEQATGRTLTIGGDVSVSVFPTATVTLEEVALANAEGASEPDMVTLDRLDVALNLLPLLTGAVEVDRFVLEGPVINLEIAEDGTPNWLFPATADDGASDGPGDGTGTGGGVPAVTLGEVRISDGRFTFLDRRTGQTITVADADLTVEATALTAPVSLEGLATVGDTPVTLSVAVDTPQALLDGATAGVDVRIDSAPIVLMLDGDLSLAASPGFDGSASLTVPSIARVVELVDAGSMVPALPVDQVDFTGDIAASPSALSLGTFRLAVDDMSVSGDFAADLSGDVPTVTGDIAISEFDLDAIRAAMAAGDATGEATGETGQAPPPAPEGGDSADPMTQPIDLSPLGMAQVDLSLDVAGLQLEGAAVGEAQIRIQLQDRLLQVNLDETEIFDGTVALTATADGVAETPSFSGSLRLDGVDIGQVVSRVSIPSVTDLGGAITGEVVVEASGATPEALLADIRARSTLSLTNGAATVSPATGNDLVLSRATVSVSLPTIDGPLDVGGNADLNGQTVSVEAAIGNPRGLLAGQSVAVRTAVTSEPVSQSFDGTVANLGQSLSGALTLDVPSLTALATWLGIALPEGLPVDSIDLSGTADVSPSAVSVADLDLTAGDITATGSAGVDLSGAVPNITANLAMGALDIDRLTGGATADGGEAGGASGDGGGGAGGGWSSEPIVDYGALLLANADIDVSLEAVTVQGITTGPTALAADLQGGVLNASLSETAVFEGTVAGTLSANAGSETLGLGLTIAGMNARPLLTQFAGTDRLSGTVNANADLTMAGRSQQQLVSALNGSGSVLFTDGAIQGINIAAVLRNPLQAIANPDMLASQSTDFAELGGTFTASNGTVTNPDLYMLAPLFRLNGAGDIMLPPRTLDYRVEPTLTATLEGQGGAVTQSGLTVPIRITGSFDNPSYSIDMRPEDALGFLGSPEQAVERVRGALEGGAEGVIGDLLQGAGDGANVQDILNSGDPASALNNALGGILGGGEQPAPAAGTDGGAASGETAPTGSGTGETAPAEAPQEQQSPQDQVRDAVEDAVGGAVRGLFGN